MRVPPQSTTIITALQGGACGITSARVNALPRAKNSSAQARCRDRAAPFVLRTLRSNLKRKFTDVENLPLPVVRRRGRGGREVLCALLPDSRIEHVQKNSVDSRAGKAGSVLVVEFTLAGQRFMALNGGKAFDFTHAISFKIDCADQAEVDRYWDALSEGGSVEQCGWLKDRYGVSWQIVPTALVKYLGGPDRAGAQRAMQAMMGMVKLDIAGLQQAYEGKPAA